MAGRPRVSARRRLIPIWQPARFGGASAGVGPERGVGAGGLKLGARGFEVGLVSWCSADRLHRYRRTHAASLDRTHIMRPANDAAFPVGARTHQDGRRAIRFGLGQDQPKCPAAGAVAGRIIEAPGEFLPGLADGPLSIRKGRSRRQYSFAALLARAVSAPALASRR